MSPLRIITSAALLMGLLSAPTFAQEDDAEALLELATIEWAGMNCGDLVPSDVFWKATQEAGKIGAETMKPYRIKVKEITSRAQSRQVACQSVVDAFSE